MASRPAHADAKGDIAAKTKTAMESYDLMDYDAARKALNQAVAVAKKAKLDKDPLTAKVYLDLGIVAFAVPDVDAAKVAFQTAVQIDPKIQIDAAYRSGDMVKLLDEARGEASGGTPGEEMAPTGVDCGSVKGLQHNIIDSGKANAPQPLEALVGTDLSPAKVSIMYRAEGATEFSEAKMTRDGCKFTGQIPAAATHGSIVHYYIGAFDGGGKLIAGKGSPGSPNILELAAGGVVKSDGEDPLGGGGGGGGGSASGGEVKGGVEGPAKPTKIFIALAGGTGFGYVTGNTEGGNAVKTCCVGNSLGVIAPELGINISPQMALSIVGRFGLPIGANTEGHATGAPGVLARFRYALDPSGDGIRVAGSVGVGVLRNTIKLNMAETSGGDTDIVAQGPLLIGAGLGYNKKLTNNIAFMFDFTLLAGIAVTSSFDAFTAPVLNSGVSADVSLGFAIGI